MRIHSKAEGSILTISLEGSLDIEGVPAFEKCKELLAGDVSKVYFDFENLEFIDSTGIGTIVHLVKAHEHLAFQVINLNEDVKEIFSIVGLDEFFTF